MSESGGKPKSSDDAPETELDVVLPGKVALAHVNELEFAERETLQQVHLPTKQELKDNPPEIAPVLAPMEEANRPTEIVDLSHTSDALKPPPEARAAPHPASLILIGAVIGSAVTLILVLLLY